ncbi:MAG: hypothetical protein ACREUL_20135 [Steroidobacteraceae bacterium]
MKYFPLVWSALWRKPVEAILVWLAVTAAFALFGLMVGLHVTYDRLIESSRMDRLDINARFPSASPRGVLLPIALRDQIARIQGVSAVGSYYWLWGYYQNPHKIARVIAVDRHMRAAWSELPLIPAQWDRLFAMPTGVFVSRAPAARLGLRAGDTFPLITAPGLRADGTATWEFHVLGIVPDDPRIGAFILGNYGYLDKSRPLQDQGLVMGFRVAVRDAAQADEVSLRIDRHFANSSTPTLRCCRLIELEEIRGWRSCCQLRPTPSTVAPSQRTPSGRSWMRRASPEVSTVVLWPTRKFYFGFRRLKGISSAHPICGVSAPQVSG